MNALQLCRRQFSHKQTLYQTFFKQSAILQGKRPFCVIAPLWGGGLGTTYDVPWAHWKARNGLPISVN